jgi:hypothetical protein
MSLENVDVYVVGTSQQKFFKKPKVLNKTFCSVAKDDVYIGRGSIWGNPYIIGVHGTRDEVLVKYEARIRNSPRHLNKLSELIGKNLVCYCAPLPCHGDVLLKLLEEQARVSL